MSNFSFNQRCFIDSYHSADPVVTGYPSTWPNDSALDWQTDASIPDTSWIPHDNALGLSGMSAPEPDWTAYLSTRLSVTPALNHIDTTVFETSLAQFHPPSSAGAVHLWQPNAFQIPSVCDEDFVGARETAVSHSAHPITPPAPEPIARPLNLNRRISPSRLHGRPMTPRSQRHTAYPMRHDSAKRCAPTTVYRCEWIDGAIPCGAVVAGTKNAVRHHLQAAHAIRLKASKTIQVCRWEMCHSQMRRESIARHILAVHMQHGVHCPDCGSHFARMDSLQRHKRTLCLATDEEVDAPEVGV